MRDPFNQGRRGWDDARRAFKEHLREQMRGMQEHGGPFGPPHPPEPPEPPFPGEARGFGPGFFGPGFGGPGGFGPGFGFGPGRGRGRGRGQRHSSPGRARRGNVRAAVLMLLAERPMHGYEMIQEITQRSGGWWRPSPGSVYPTLQMLEDAGLVRASEQDGRRTYELTDEGRAEAEEAAGASSGQGGQRGQGPFGGPETEGRAAIRYAVMQLHMAARQVAMSGTPDQIDRAAAALRQARQALYHILAED